MKSRFSAALAVIPLVIGGVIAVAGSPASANCTNHPWSNKDTSSGYTIDSTPIRVGPHENCDRVITVGAETFVYYHCFTINEAGNLWTHVRIAGTSTNGWVYDGHLGNFGSFVRC